MLQKKQSQGNRVNLVNENDKIIGEGDKIEVHLGNGLLHQAISLFLFYRKRDGSVKLLMQQRSAKKIVGANQWANTICGNVAAGETHKGCVLRRLKEELGWDLPIVLAERLKDLTTFRYRVKCNEQYSENEIDHIFALEINKDEFDKYFSLKLNSGEVAEIAWVNWPIKDLKDKELTPWFQMFLDSSQVMGALNKFLKERN